MLPVGDRWDDDIDLILSGYDESGPLHFRRYPADQDDQLGRVRQGSRGRYTCPAGTAGVVGPKPVPKIIRVLPGLAGRDAAACPRNPDGAT